MKRKNAFTLIELLAVIVVLAIIALIATPIVMNTIKKSKKGSAERSADSYIKQVETAVTESRINGTKIANGTYNIQPDGNLCPASGCGKNDKDKITIDMSGTKPTSGTVTIKNGGVSQDGTTMTVGDYIVSYDKDNNKQIAQELYKGILCTAKTAATTGKVPSGNYFYGDEYTCELGDNNAKTFFVLETNGDNVSLIMDRNIDSNGKGTTSGNTVTWCKSGSDNSCAADGALEYLKTSTTSWTKLTESQISLPSYDQIYKAAGNKTSGLPTWLYGNLKVNNSVPYAYWTSTPHAFSSRNAWFVRDDGRLNLDYVDYGSYYGVRPVITVSKSNLS